MLLYTVPKLLTFPDYSSGVKEKVYQQSAQFLSRHLNEMYESEGTNIKDQKDLGEVEEGESRIVTVARSRSIATGREGGAQLSLSHGTKFLLRQI
jgi:hypothetical protein